MSELVNRTHKLIRDVERHCYDGNDVAALLDTIAAMERVVEAARARLEVWTPETYGGIVGALAALDAIKGGEGGEG